MKTEIQYIVDKSGEKTSVVVPMKDWKRLNKDHEKLLKKISVLTGIRKGLIEVQHARKAGKHLPALESFIHELKGKN